jgi:hypothetical protein
MSDTAAETLTDAERREMLIGVLDLGASFVPDGDAPELAARRAAFAELRAEAEQLVSIPDASLARALFGSVMLLASTAHALREVGLDCLDYAEELEAVVSGRREARGFHEQQIRSAVQELRERLDKAPTRELVAGHLRTSEATLKRAMQDLGMGPWPPAPPES